VIVVTGSTGRIGSLVAEELARSGVSFRALVRDRLRAPLLPGVEVVQGDYGDPDTLDEALQEGDRVFMVSIHSGPEVRLSLHRSFVVAMARRRVGRIVYLSFVNAGPEAIFLHARSHGATEAMLADSGLPFTAVRNGMYADEIPGWFDGEGVAREPVGDGRISFSYRPELAEAIAVTLTDDGHDGAVYDVVSQPVTLKELATIASEATGMPHRYEPAAREDWEARWRDRGRPEWSIEVGLTSFDAQRAGEFDIHSDDFRRLTGREPLPIAEVVARLPFSRSSAT
jgi:NAD(P)H dehydrogenase (quinone)